MRLARQYERKIFLPGEAIPRYIIVNDRKYNFASAFFQPIRAEYMSQYDRRVMIGTFKLENPNAARK